MTPHRFLHLGFSVLVLALLAAPIAEARGARPRRHVLGAGTSWETVCWVCEGPEQGPTVLIVGGMHGNEPAGAVAADQIRHWPLRAGRLVVLPRANVRALAVGKRHTPDAPYALRNLNRNFPDATAEDPSRDRPRGEVAPAIWSLIRTYEPDWIVDLHEGFAPYAINPKSCGRSVIAHPEHPASMAMADRLLAVANAEVEERARRFVRLRQTTPTTLARSAGDAFGIPTLIVETCFSKVPLSRRTRTHRLLVHALLGDLGMLEPTVTTETVFPVRRDVHEVRVAVYDAGGTGGPGVAQTCVQLGADASLLVARVCPKDVRGGVLEQSDCDVAVFAGGSGSAQARALGDVGRERVLAFVEAGGGYVGVCAGAYLITAGFSWSVPLLDAKTASPHWRRGRGTVEMEATALGRRHLGLDPGRTRVRYGNGPVILPLAREDLPDYEVWAWFRTELAEGGAPEGVMVDSPAIAASSHGEGRVVWISPHPEQTPGLEPVMPRAVRWAAKR